VRGGAVRLPKLRASQVGLTCSPIQSARSQLGSPDEPTARANARAIGDIRDPVLRRCAFPDVTFVHPGTIA
jgi:hypothetical protein